MLTGINGPIVETGSWASAVLMGIEQILNLVQLVLPEFLHRVIGRIILPVV
jgi:hypothetical protein